LEFDEKRMGVINRILEEKGEEAIPTLLSLIEKNEDDGELILIVAETITRMGRSAYRSLLDYLNKNKQQFIENPREYKEQAYRTTLLMVIDMVGELGFSQNIGLLEFFLGLFEEEKAHLIIYEAIAKLGGGAKYLDLLELFAFEDDFVQELISQVIMTLSYIEDPRALFDLLKISQFDWLDTNQEAMVENAMRRLLHLHREYYELLEKDPYGQKMLKRLLGEA